MLEIEDDWVGDLEGVDICVGDGEGDMDGGWKRVVWIVLGSVGVDDEGVFVVVVVCFCVYVGEFEEGRRG